MMDIKENQDFLRSIAGLTKPQVTGILKKSTSKQLSALAQIAKNVLTNNLKIKQKFKSALKRYRKIIRSLALSKISHKKKIDLVVHNTLAVITLIRSVWDTITKLIK